VSFLRTRLSMKRTCLRNGLHTPRARTSRRLDARDAPGSARRVFPSEKPKANIAAPIEEETIPSYDSKSFYPARIGEVLGGRYHLISKLGWGTSSTVWLAGISSWSGWAFHVASRRNY
jgi:hypothetical protein